MLCCCCVRRMLSIRWKYWILRYGALLCLCVPVSSTIERSTLIFASLHFLHNFCRHAGPYWKSWRLIGTSMSACPENLCMWLPPYYRVFSVRAVVQNHPSVEGVTSLTQRIHSCYKRNLVLVAKFEKCSLSNCEMLPWTYSSSSVG
jgi:hypothetical protein